MADEQPGSGVTTDSPTVPDFTTYAAEADARDLAGRTARATRTATPSTPPADSSPAPAGEAPAQAEAKTESPPVTPEKPARPPKNADTRVQELLAERAAERARADAAERRARELEAQIAGRPGAPKANSPTAPPTTAEWQRYRAHPNAPKAEDFDTYEDFVAAQALFVADQRFEERLRKAQLDRESHERMGAVEKDITTFRAQLAKAREADAGWNDKVHPGLTEIIPAFALRPNEPVLPANVIVQEIVRSDVAPALLVHFSTPEGQQEWQQLVAAPTPAALLRAFGRIEARFSGSPAAPAATPISRAPEPPTVVGGTKPPASPDRLAAAVRAGDFAAYEAEATARDLARRGR